MNKANKAAKITKTGNKIFPVSIPLPPGTMDGNGWEDQATEKQGTPIPSREELAAHNSTNLIVNPFKMDIGDQATGLYFRVPFTGIITDLRPNYVNHKKMVITIAIDNPITIHGRVEPKEILMEVYSYGTDETGTCSLAVIA